MKEIRYAYVDIQVVNFRKTYPTTSAPQIFSMYPSARDNNPPFYPEDVDGTFMNTLNKTAELIANKRLHVL